MIVRLAIAAAVLGLTATACAPPPSPPYPRNCERPIDFLSNGYYLSTGPDILMVGPYNQKNNVVLYGKEVWSTIYNIPRPEACSGLIIGIGTFVTGPTNEIADGRCRALDPRFPHARHAVLADNSPLYPGLQPVVPYFCENQPPG